MSWLRRLRTAWPGAWRREVTRTGVIYSAMLVVISLGAFISGNNLLYLVLSAMWPVLFVSGFVSKLVLAGLEVDVAVPRHISARRDIRGVLRLKNVKRWMPSFSIHVAGTADSGFNVSLYFPVVPAGTTLEEPIAVYFPKRGRRHERTFQLTTRFPFGFAERRELVTLRQEIIVYPCIDPYPGFEALLASVNGEIEIQQRGQGRDFHRIRPYEALESWRHVDWKATAHTGALQVREYSRDDDTGVVIYFDIDVAAEHQVWFEESLDCAAFLAYHLAALGRRVRFRSQDIDVRVPHENDVYAILKYLALVSPRPGARPQAPDETDEFQVIFSADRARMESLGWRCTPLSGTGVIHTNIAGTQARGAYLLAPKTSIGATIHPQTFDQTAPEAAVARTHPIQPTDS